MTYEATLDNIVKEATDRCYLDGRKGVAILGSRNGEGQRLREDFARIDVESFLESDLGAMDYSPNIFGLESDFYVIDLSQINISRQ